MLAKPISSAPSNYMAVMGLSQNFALYAIPAHLAETGVLDWQWHRLEHPKWNMLLSNQCLIWLVPMTE